MALPKSSAPRSDLSALRDRPNATVLIIGGGINGIATFRDLALQGVDVALVERGDFVSGASSASSHMVHGGVRYLENGEFRLVKESVTERNGLLKIAPHYVRPLETTIPIFRTFSGILSAPFKLLTHRSGKPKERGALLIEVGLNIYDTFSRDGGSVPRHRFHGKKKSLHEFPDMNHDLKYTATYYDASMWDPERLALDVLHDGMAAGGDQARAVNYVEAIGSGDKAIRLRDTVTGDEFEFSADLVINTSGPWTDLTNSALGVPTRYMGGTKGSHIVLDNQKLLDATNGREIFFENSDGRIVLIYPLKGRVLAGTTDIDADPSKPAVITDEEIEYFFELIRHVFPTIPVERSQIVYTFSGIRPLPKHDDTAPGFVSRDYRIEKGVVGGIPSLSLVGGKWTTFRALAESVADHALEALGRERKVSTAKLEIGGGKNFPRTPHERAAWIQANRGPHDEATGERMLERYGTRAIQVLEALPAVPTELPDAHGYYSEEVAHLAQTEQVVHLIDLLLRRTSLGFVGGMSIDTLREIATAIAPVLGWDDARASSEVDDAVAFLRDAHKVNLGPSAAART